MYNFMQIENEKLCGEINYTFIPINLILNIYMFNL